MKRFNCTACHNQVYFENTECGACGGLLAFVPGELSMATFEPEHGTPGAAAWQRSGHAQAGSSALWPCANRVQYGVCNWMLEDGAAAQSLCLSCQLTSTVPALGDPANQRRWAVIEAAKRRLVFTLLSMHLPFHAKQGADDVHGLEFRWLAATPGAPVTTGHEDGTVTLDIAEADDDHREAARVTLGEPLRTVLGHLRHELSHHLHQRWVEGSTYEAPFRALFGDERADYGAALKAYYEQGAPQAWEQSFISAYASAHPWEDWAETCAHYLLMVDAVETAGAWGLRLNDSAGAGPGAHAPVAEVELSELVLGQWLPVARFLNAMSRSLGLRDSYPFLMADAVLEKLRFVQMVLGTAAAHAGTPIASNSPVVPAAAGAANLTLRSMQ